MFKEFKKTGLYRNILLALFSLASVLIQAQVSVGNQSTKIKTPGSQPVKFNHTHNTGTDGVLVVAISMNSNNSVSNVRYKGQLMTKRVQTSSESGFRYGFWELENPPTGTNEVKITMTAYAGNKIGAVAQSFTGAKVGGNTGNNGRSNSPHSRNRTVSAGSVMMVMGLCESNPGSQTFSINGVNTSRTLLNAHKRMGLATSTAPLTAGSIPCITRSNTSSNRITNYTLEIQSAGPTCSVTNSTNSPTVCKGSSTNIVTHTTSSVTGITSSSGFPAGVTPSYSSNAITINGSPTERGSFSYTIDVTGCSDDATGTIVVPYTPGGVCDDLTLWLDAQDIDADGIQEGTSESGISGGATTTWKDKSGQVNDVTGSSVTQILNTLNYNPVLDFASDALTAPNSNQITANTDYTKFVVFSYDDASSTSNNLIGSAGGGGSTMWGDGSKNSVRMWNLSGGTPRNYITTGDILSPTTYYMISGRYGNGGGLNNILNVNGQEISNNTTSQAHNASPVQIGAYNGGNYLNGKIAEAIVYDRALTDNEIDKIESYLAIKYGFTIDNTAGGTSGDYTSSDGTLLWDADQNSGTYHNDILGLGKDEAELFYRKQSKTNDDSLRVYVGAFSSGNDANSGTITNDISYLTIGNNKGLLAATSASNVNTPNDIFSRFERIWKVTNTNFNDDYTLEFKWKNIGDFDINDIRLLVDVDEDFSDAYVFSSSNGLSFTEGSIIVNGIGITHIPANSTRYFTIGSVDSGTPLPIELINFNAAIYDGAAHLNWQTSMELSNAFFTVERSLDLTSFEAVAKIPGAGNSNKLLNYFYIDENPYQGVSYYRLKQTDYNGDYEYSQIRSVTNSSSNRNLKVYPNPTTGLITIKGLKEIHSNLLVHNVFGENVSGLTKKTKSNETQISLDLYGLKNGIYFLRVEGAVFKLVKE